MADYQDKLDITLHGWLRDPGAVRIIEAIAAGGGEARFVGGCVRDALRGVSVGEIDLAANMRPERVSEILKMEGIKVVPTGIDHGTITAVANGKAFEITSLRRDIKTDGRHASVDYTDDWQEDASRRDFTINALYVDISGNIYDYFNGRADIAAGKVRFIGDANLRIKEDVLRILRFFRMIANSGGKNVEIDRESFNACKELAHLIPGLSVERVWSEIKKMLVSSGVVRGWELMEQSGALKYFLPEARNIGTLINLIEVENKHAEPSAIRRLAALVFEYKQDGTALAEELKVRLRLSNHEARELKACAGLPLKLRGRLDPVPLRRIVYENDAESVRDALLLLSAFDGINSSDALEVATQWVVPNFPVGGEDLLKLGMCSGPKVGEVLKQIEEWWKDADFRPTREECLNKAKETIN